MSSSGLPRRSCSGADGLTRVDEFEARHVIETGSQLMAHSTAISERVANGQLAIVGATYHLADGQIALQ